MIAFAGVLTLALLGPQVAPSLAARVEADDVAGVRAAMLRSGASGDELTDLLWMVSARIQLQRRHGRLASAAAWLPFLEEAAPRSDQGAPLRVYVAGEWMQIWLGRGAPDLAARAHEQVEERRGEMDRKAPGADYLDGVALLYDVDYRIAVEDFDGAIERIESLPDATRKADESINGELSTRRAIAEIGRACRDPARAGIAADLLRTRLAAADGDERYRLACLLATVELRRGETAAARAALDDAGPATVDDHDVALRRATLEARFAVADRATPAVLLQRDQDLATALDASFRHRVAESDTDDAIGYLHYEFALEALVWRIALCDALHEPSRAIEAVLHAQSFGRLSRRLHGDLTRASDLRATLPEDGVLLCYVPGPDRSWLLAVDSAGESIHPLPASYRLKQDRDVLARATVEQLDADGIDTWRRDAATAASRLLPEAVRPLLRRARRVTICALGFLASVDFESLPLDGEMLGCRLAVDRLPSLPLARVLASRFEPQVALDGDGGVACALLLGPTVAPSVASVHSSVGPLPYTRGALEALADAFPRDRVECWIGADADVTAFERARPAILLTLLCHGVERFPRMRPASLVLAPSSDHDGIIGCDEVEAGAVARVVVVAACRAGRGPLRGGNESALDLGGAFLAAGAGAVILAPHALETESAREAVAAIHEALAEGCSPAEALRRARVASAAEDGSFGGWIVVGSGHRAPFVPVAPQSSRAAWNAAAACLAFTAAGALAVLAYRKQRRRTDSSRA